MKIEDCTNFVVYKIYCRSNNKSYIGITNNFKRRFAIHWHNKEDTVLARTIRKYGKSNFIVRKLAVVYVWKDACDLEKFYIKRNNTKIPNGMNMTDGGDGLYGLHYSKSTREKMSKSHKGRFCGQDNPMYGKIGPNKGRKFSEEIRRKVSEATKGRVPWNKGKRYKLPHLAGKNSKLYGIKPKGGIEKGWNHTEDIKRKMSLSRKGRHCGVKNNNLAKLTNENIIDIRKIYEEKKMNQYELATKFKVTQSNVHYIITRKSWSHI